MSTEVKPWFTFVFKGWHFPCYPLLQSIIMILFWMLIKYIGNITFGFKLIQVGLIFEFVFRSRYFLEYHPSLSIITRCQVPSRVRVWFHNSAGDIDFYQMSAHQNQLFYMKVLYKKIRLRTMIHIYSLTFWFFNQIMYS